MAPAPSKPQSGRVKKQKQPQRSVMEEAVNDLAKYHDVELDVEVLKKKVVGTEKERERIVQE